MQIFCVGLTNKDGVNSFMLSKSTWGNVEGNKKSLSQTIKKTGQHKGTRYTRLPFATPRSFSFVWRPSSEGKSHVIICRSKNRPRIQASVRC
ncbi:MAG: hypothetical protein CL920_23115 [Deltaproteobacteria bacterium]|nr:hypothetical protein [Deltaproteobacteria bacterium]